MKALKVQFLGGVGEIGKNMTALEYGDEIIVIDAGMSFPNDDMPGVDLVIPDTKYLVDNISKVKAFVLTHGHEDHIGALPYILRDINVPIYASQLTLGLLENKFKEHRLDNLKMNCVKAGDVRKVSDSFTVEFIKVNHSITGAFAFCITTPVGTVFHTGDYKVDFTPVDEEVINLNRIAEIGNKGVMLMMGESTNVEREGFSMSETSISESLSNIFNANSERRMIVATFASNIHRIQQIIDIAYRFKRKVAFSGRSMLNVAEVAAKLGELRYDKDQVIDIERIKNVRDKDLVIITTGSQGEAMSALTRMAAGEFNKVTIGKNDTIIISATPIPGNEKHVYNVINNLYRLGAEVVYESLENVHVSGHAFRGEIKLMLNLIKPKFFVPVHGEYRHLRQHALIAEKMGMDARRILIADIGTQIEVTPFKMRKLDNIPAGHLLVDGGRVGDVGTIVLKDRKKMSEDGLVAVVVGVNTLSGEVTGPDIISRGFVFVKESDALIEQAKEIVLKAMGEIDIKKNFEWAILKERIIKELRKYFNKSTGRNPMIIPMIMEI